MPAVDKRDAETLGRLRAVGEMLYGENWRAPLGDALLPPVSRVSVSAWDNGRWPPPDDLDERLLELLRRERDKRARDLFDVAETIKQFERLIAGRRA